MRPRGSGKPVGFFLFAFPPFGAALVSLPFAFEASKAEAMLRDIYAPAPARPDEGPYRT